MSEIGFGSDWTVELSVGLAATKLFCLAPVNPILLPNPTPETGGKGCWFSLLLRL